MTELLEAISRAHRLLYGVFKYPTEEDKIKKPKESKQIKMIAKGLKVPTDSALNVAGSLMASYISDKLGFGKPVLVPIPSSKGDTSSNRRLCEVIVKHFPAGSVLDILGTESGMSSYDLRTKDMPGKKAI